MPLPASDYREFRSLAAVNDGNIHEEINFKDVLFFHI